MNKTRRQVIKTVALSTAVIPLSSLLASRPGHAQEKVDENDQVAKSLNYKHDANAVTDAKRSADQFCYNCQLYQGQESEEWAACAIFQNKLVAGKGWCSAWIKKVS